jgi:RNA polymerase sigma-70 factor (ECF subfamily)
VFEAAILPHLDAAYNLARWLVHDPLDAEHLVEEACIRALRGPAAIRSGDERVWLLQIVRDTVYAELKIRALADGVVPCSVVDQAEFDAAVTALPIELRECLILREVEALSYHEIALITGTSINIVASRLDRARDLLIARQNQDRKVL